MHLELKEKKHLEEIEGDGGSEDGLADDGRFCTALAELIAVIE